MFFVITDTHLGHQAMINLCGRPDNFSQLVRRNWKDMVTKSDTVIHLGDVAWSDEQLTKLLKLPGRKILIRGNHDKKTNEEYMQLGFDFCCDELTLVFDGMQVLFSHRPHFGHTADINIHGHQHDLHRDDYSRLYLPLALEAMGYKPIAMDADFIKTLHSWVDRHHIPTLKELIALRQNYLEKPLERDLYGWYGAGTEATWKERVRRNEEFDYFIRSLGPEASQYKAKMVNSLRERFLLNAFDNLENEWHRVAVKWKD